MKLSKIPSALAVAAFLAVPAYAQDTVSDSYVPTEDELDSVRAAMAGVGCTINTEDLALAVEEATRYDVQSLEAIVDLLRVYQEVVDSSDETGGITLVSGDCAV